ncbi:DUF3772 domain-containing protein [Sphingomonas sp. Tas61C01]|uniref:DUF3772 domain-containing protein n=1 Tax=Sphingomonas sp. Tas61C01 TaxID=3458297 RepID=UPI00403E5216
MLDRAERGLKATDAALGGTVDVNARKQVRTRLVELRADTITTVDALQDVLDRVDARIGELGPVPKVVSEAENISIERQRLIQQRAATDSAIKRGRLLRLEAQQLLEELAANQTEQITKRVSTRAASPLSPSLWIDLASAWPGDIKRVTTFAVAGMEGLQRGIKAGQPVLAALAALLALVFLFPVRYLARAAGRRFLIDEVPGQRLRRSAYAWWRVTVGTAVPLIAALIFVNGLRGAGFVASRWDPLLGGLIWATGISAFVAALGGALLLRGHPAWRLISIDDDLAIQLRFWTWVLASIAFVAPLLDRFNIVVEASPSALLATEMLEAVLHAILLVGVLVTIGRLRVRHAAEREVTSDGTAAHVGIVLTLVALWGVTLVAIAGLLAGYIGFSLFVARFVTWFAIVAGTLYLLVVVLDDISTGALSSGSRLGRLVSTGTGLRNSTIDQAGVLLSGILRVAAALMALSLLLAPFGAGTSAVFDRLGVLAQGVTIGQVSIAPAAILRALAVLAIALLLARMFQGWLTNRYLPATQLDAGARNSLVLVSRYVGISLAFLWALASLGIGIERIALLLSALSVGIGFGLQAITQNFVSGLILLAERPVKIGDLVRIGNDEGDVKRINVRSTEIELADHSTLIVPNSELITKSVLNKTVVNAMGRVEIVFTVPIESDVKHIRSIVLDLFAAEPAVLDLPKAAVFIDGIANDRVTFKCLAHVDSARHTYPTRSAVLMELLDRLRSEGIEIGSMPQRLELVPIVAA